MIRNAHRTLSYPLILAAAVGLAAFGLRFWKPTFVVGVVVLVVAALIALLEHLDPHRADWARSHGDVQTDVLSTLFGMVPVPFLFKAIATSALAATGAWLSSRLGVALWPSHWPLGLQLLLALVVAELGQYWVHRLAHERATLWRLHSVHHGAERLYWLNAGRFHPLDTLMQHAAEMAPLILLGAPPELIALFTVFTATNGLLRHGNFETKPGALNWILSTSDLHRWHHSVDVEHSNANYGANLILWDVLFRTRKLPAAASPSRLGLPYDARIRTFGDLLVAPFRAR